jgi:sulfite exporter TauE/SafE
MKAATLDRLVWMLLFGGLVAVGLGWSVQRSDGALGWTLIVAGGAMCVLGIALIVVRARVKDTPGDTP